MGRILRPVRFRGNSMRVLRKVLAALVVTGFALSLAGAFLLQTYSSTLASPSYVMQIVSSPAVRAAQRDMLTQHIAPSIVKSAGLAPATAQKLAEQAVTDDLLHTMNGTVAALFARLLQGDAAILHESVDVTNLRTNLAAAAKALVQTIPDCKLLQIPTRAETGLPTCVPASQRAAVLAQVEKSILAQVPAQFDVQKAAIITAANLTVLRRVYQAAPIGWALSALLLLLLLVLNLDERHTPLGWLGGGAVAGGILSLGAVWIVAVLPNLAAVSSQSDLTQRFLAGAIQGINVRLMAMASAALVVGVLLLVMLVQMRRPRLRSNRVVK